MKRSTFSLLLLSGLLICAVGTAQAGLITQTLGTKRFNDGDTPTTGAFLVAHAGDPAPFDGVFRGSDVNIGGTNFSASWMFSYGALSNITGATLTLGIFDHDSAAPGSQVASFTLNGTLDLTSLLDVEFETSPGANRQVRDYTITLPSSAFAPLATGTATFSLALQGPGLGILGPTRFNGAALDFSTISITTQEGPTVPEPASVMLLLIGLAAFFGLRLRSTQRPTVRDDGQTAN